MTKPVRVICYAWGDKYVADFCGITLPALLAPGNLPLLAGRFAVQFVFLTEERRFDYVRATPAWQQLAKICPAKLMPLDDLIVGHWYGISLSKALVRGFADLGEAMLDTYLIFLNADFIVADGSYRSVAERIEAGERLIFAPSYCVVREAVLPRLRRRQVDSVLAVPPREMAALSIPHRHYTIRAKTANQKLFRIHRYDQFYWYVDERTLLARQMPIALVAMRPQRVLLDIETFWDYGVVSEFCPTASHCVLGDSDEYLMIELRDERTFEELIGFGWPTLDEIGEDLSSFTTKDQRDHLQHELIWHSGDLPPHLEVARAELGRFVEQVAQRLTPQPVSHLKHQFWESSIHRFEALRAEFLANRGRQAAPAEVAPGGDALVVAPAVKPKARPKPARLRASLGMISQRMFGRVPFVRKPHPYWADLRHAMRAVTEKMPLESTSVLLVGPGAGLFERLVMAGGRCVKTTPGVLLEEPIRSMALEGNLLVRVVDKDGVAREIEARQVTVLEEQYREADVPVPAWVAAGPFDLCVCELQVADLRRFRDLFEVIRPQMRPHGRIVVVCLDAALQSQAEMTRIIRSAFPVEGVSEVLFSGSPGSRFARRLVERAISGKAASGRMSKLRIAGMFAAAALTSWASARSVERQAPYKFVPHSTSLTMVIDLP